MASSQVCRDFVNGYCRFGSSCRYYHPPWNSNSNHRVNPTALGSKPDLKYQFTEGTLRTELQNELPQWILSSFGAAKQEPNLFFDYDISPEEMRWKSVMALKENGTQTYVSEEADLNRKARDTITSALSNLSATVKIAQKLHDARYPSGTNVDNSRPPEFSEAAAIAAPTPAGNTNTPFGQAQSRATGFGQSGGGAFGQSAFGSSSKPTAFGSDNISSAFGSTTTPTAAFGSSASPSAFGSSSFGQKPATSSAFGATFTSTSAFGSSSAPPSAFGSSAFGSTSAPSPTAFGSTTTPASPFGSAATPSPFGGASAAPSAFGQTPPAPSAFSSTNPSFGATSTAAPAPGSAFGQSAFGQGPKPNGFGGFGQSQTNQTPAASSSAFGAGAFGQSTAPATSPFSSFSGGNTQSQTPTTHPTSSSSAFGGFGSKPSQPTSNPFGTSSQPISSGSDFGSSAFSSARPTFIPNNPFGSSTFSSTSTSTIPAFPSDVKIPEGWSYDDPWSYLLPTEAGTEPGGKIDAGATEAFRSSAFDLGAIPSLPPPISLRG